MPLTAPRSDDRAPASDALASLETYRPALRRYFLRHLDVPDAEDLVQDVFIGMRARKTDTPIERLDGYIFSVAANILRQHSRRRALASPLGSTLDDVSGLAASDEPSPERSALSRDALARALAIIETLPPRTREIFVLHRFEELSYGVIAARQGVSVSAVEKHIMAALRALAALRSGLK